MFDPERLLGKLLGKALNPKTSRSKRHSLGLPGGAGGWVGLLGGVAMAAMEHYNQQSKSTAVTQPPPRESTSVAATSVATDAAPPPPPPPTAAPIPSPMMDTNRLALALIRAMIAAAKADGAIDAEERRRILERLGDASAEELAFVEAEMAKPLDLDELLADIPGPQAAVEVYTVSLLAIELDTQAEAGYLRDLAWRLNLPRNTVEQLHRQLGAPPL